MPRKPSIVFKKPDQPAEPPKIVVSVPTPPPDHIADSDKMVEKKPESPQVFSSCGGSEDCERADCVQHVGMRFLKGYTPPAGTQLSAKAKRHQIYDFLREIGAQGMEVGGKNRVAVHDHLIEYAMVTCGIYKSQLAAWNKEREKRAAQRRESLLRNQQKKTV